MKFQYGIFDTDLYRKEYPDKIQLKKQDVSIEQKKLWLSLLRSDIENYFLCAKCGNGENIIFMKTLFRFV